MTFTWDWGSLITGIVGIVIGWLAKVLHISSSSSS